MVKPDLKTPFLISQHKNHKNFCYIFLFYRSAVPKKREGRGRMENKVIIVWKHYIFWAIKVCESLSYRCHSPFRNEWIFNVFFSMFGWYSLCGGRAVFFLFVSMLRIIYNSVCGQANKMWQTKNGQSFSSKNTVDGRWTLDNDSLARSMTRYDCSNSILMSFYAILVIFNTRHHGVSLQQIGSTP